MSQRSYNSSNGLNRYDAEPYRSNNGDYFGVYVKDNDDVTIAKAFPLEKIEKGKSGDFIIYFDTFCITMSYALAYALIKKFPSVFIVDHFSKLHNREIYYCIGCFTTDGISNGVISDDTIRNGAISNDVMPLVTIHFYTNYCPSFVPLTTDYNYHICSENGQQTPARWSIGKKNDNNDDHDDHFILSADLKLNYGVKKYNYIVSNKIETNMFFAFFKYCFGSI